MPRRPDLFAYELREGAEYRVERLEEERELLNRRLTWAMRRGDDAAVERLVQRLDAIEEAIDADLTPGRPPNKFDHHWR